MHRQETSGGFGFHLAGRRNAFQVNDPFVQIFVKSSMLSRVADLAISPHLFDEEAIDRFVDEEIAALEAIRRAAKGALTEALTDRPH